MVKSIKEPTHNAEDVEEQLSTNKRKDVQHVDSLQPLWEDSMDGHRKWEPEREKELEEWGTWRLYQEELVMDSEVEL